MREFYIAKSGLTHYYHAEKLPGVAIMPFVGLGLHILIALYFAIHAVRTGRNLFWLLILFSFPILGSAVYFVVEMLPELRSSRTVRHAGYAIGGMLDPSRELREAQNAFDLSQTADNRTRLANALLAHGDTAGAIEHFRASVQGIHANDASLLWGYAQALFANNDFAETRKVLEQLRGQKERMPTQESHLLYARTLTATAQREQARVEYENLIGYFAGPEARCRYAAWLHDEGEVDRAKQLYREVINEARHMTNYARDLHREWLRQAAQGLDS